MKKKLAYLICLTCFFYACSNDQSQNDDNVEEGDTTKIVDAESEMLDDIIIKTDTIDTLIFDQINSKEQLLSHFGLESGLYFTPPSNIVAPSTTGECLFAFNLPQNTAIDVIYTAHVSNSLGDTALNYIINLKDDPDAPKTTGLTLFKIPVNSNDFDGCINSTARVYYQNGIIEATRVSTNNNIVSVIQGAGALISTTQVNNQTRQSVPYSSLTFDDYTILANTPDFHSYSQTNQAEVSPVEILLQIPAGKVISHINVMDSVINNSPIRTYEMIVGDDSTKPNRMEPFNVDLSWAEFQTLDQFVLAVFEGTAEKKKKVLKADTDTDPEKGL